MDENAMKLKYKKCKYKVKKWESEFKNKNGVNPSKVDIKKAPSKIKEAYRIYYLLKTQELESKLLDITFDENTQDCFNLNNSIIDFSFNELDETISQVGDNSIFNSILDETTSTVNLSHLKEAGEEIEKNIFLNHDKENDHADTLVNDSIKSNVSEIVSEVTFSEVVNKSDEVLDSQSSVINERKENNEETIELSNEINLNSDKVWGKHLNITLKPKKEAKPLKPLSYSFSEKLFQNFNVKLRNPRKDVSFKRKNKQLSVNPSVVGKDVSTQDSVSSPNEITNEVKNNESVVEKLEVSDGQNDLADRSTTVGDSPLAFDIFNEKVKVVIKSTPTSDSLNISCNRPAQSQSNASKTSVVLKSFDKGWLERTNNFNKLIIARNNSDLVDSRFESAESSYVNNTANKLSIGDNNSNENKCHDIDDSSNVNKEIGIINDNNSEEDDDDDIVCNSDSENDKSRSLFTISSKITKRSFDKIDLSSDRNDFSMLKRPKLVDESLNLLKNESISLSQIKNSNHNEEKITSNYKVIKHNNNLKQKPIADVNEKKEALLRKKVASGKANNNFVRINIQKKVYVRGKKTINFSKYKKKQWKKKKDLLQSDDCSGSVGIFRCYKCNDVGHYARNCNRGLDKLIPKEDIENEEEESPFPSLEEAEEIAKEAAERLCRRKQSVHVNSENKDCDDSENENKSNVEILDDMENKISVVPPLFQLNEDNTIIDTPLCVIESLYKFGHDQFHPGQEKAVMRILSGLSTLVTLSTGSGKSLCYQLPAHLFSKLSKTPCITLVVSPLVSLMEDQVTCMTNAPIKMGCLHMNQTPKQRQVTLESLKDGNLSVLIVSPETVVAGEPTPGSLASTLQDLPPITFVCIDEVHCVSQWSHNFRPSYLVLCKVLKEKFGVKTFLGLTATATKSTIKDIAEHLSIPDGLDGVVSNSPLPPNLMLTVSKDIDRDQALVKLLQSERFKAPASVIIYCTRREVCERVAMYIRTRLQDEAMVYVGKKRGRLSTIAEPYHAGLTGPKRKQVQNAFMAGQLRIVVATIAFGMGINKQDVRGVIHYNMPSSFESYVQEVGRAGRDGLEANCHVFLDSRDGDLNELRRHIFANSMDRHTLRKLLQRIFIPCTCKSDCISHEVAFSIDDTVKTLDIKEESISTLLCYLELHNKKWIKNLPHAYTMCQVQSYKGAKHLRLLARKCPPLAVAVAREIKKGIQPEKLNVLSFPVVELASSMKWDSGSVKYHLKQLEWSSNVKGVRCKSGLLVEFSDLGFRVKAPGNMSNEELDCALDSLYQRVKNQENTALSQLQCIFQTLTGITDETVDECLNEIDVNKSDKLKSQIRDYFDKPVTEPLDMPIRQEKLENEDQIISDIRSLVTSYKDCSFTGRSVARVFHGISSPNFPAIVMCRNRYWRAHLDQDFILLCNLASRELLRMR